MIDPLGGPAYWWPYILGFVICYLIGSIPFGLILTRMTGVGDLRSIGSGNIGATNVLRTGRKGVALATLVLDALKGAIQVWIAGRYFGPDMAIVAGLGAVLGHCFPIWLKFNGGKGVATAAGVVIVLTPWVALLALLFFVVIVRITSYVSLGSVLAAIISVPLAFYFNQVQAAEFYILLAIIIIIKHQANIRRLIAGNESKTTLGKSTLSEKI
ncbi:MAG: glycerol-3-phosphate 1-O-acyltransferase PlsY [Geminicoccaceae bacterium]